MGGSILAPILVFLVLQGSIAPAFAQAAIAVVTVR
jgi:hypothetical protein